MFSGSILTHALFQMEGSWFSLSHRNMCMPTTTDLLTLLDLFLVRAYDTVVSLWPCLFTSKKKYSKATKSFMSDLIKLCITSRWLNKVSVSSFNRKKIQTIFQEEILGPNKDVSGATGKLPFHNACENCLWCCSNSIPHNVFITETAIAAQIIHMPYIYFSTS